MDTSASIGHDECIQDGIAAVTVDLQKPTYAAYLHDDFDPWEEGRSPMSGVHFAKAIITVDAKSLHHLPGCITKRIHPFRVR